MKKGIISILLGIVAAVIVVSLLELPGSLMYPPPEGVSFNDKEAMGKHIENLPIFPKFMVILAYAMGAFVGGFVSTKIDVENGKYHAILVGIMIALGAIFTVIKIPHPTWMIVTGLLLPIPLAYLGSKIAEKMAKNVS